MAEQMLAVAECVFRGVASSGRRSRKYRCMHADGAYFEKDQLHIPGSTIFWFSFLILLAKALVHVWLSQVT